MPAGDPPPTRRVVVDSASIEYRWIGGPSPSAIVLLHEGLGSTSTWKEFPERLASASGESVFTYSRRGYGRSSSSPLPRGASFMHEEAHEWLPSILAAVRIEHVVLVGHSDGASIALLYASLGRTPLPRGLVLLAPHTFVEPKTVASIQSLDRQYGQDADLRERFARHHDRPETTFRGWTEVWLSPEFRDWDIQDVLPRIDAPVLVIQGEDDEYGSIEQVTRVERLVRGRVESRILPACGHAPQRDQEDACLAAMDDFLKAL